VRRDVAAAIVELIDRGDRGALATVVAASGSTPQVPGAKLLLRQDASVVGTVGRADRAGGHRHPAGGARRRQATEAPPAPAPRSGDVLRGEMELFCELVEGRAPLVFGAGHVGQALVRIAEMAGFAATVVDPRRSSTRPSASPATRIVAEFAEALARLTIHEGTFVVITTHDHSIDEDTLGRCLVLPRRYLGMIGSRRKVVRVYQRLRHKGTTASLVGVSAPVGLDLGALIPEEIAVSILAEMIAVRRGGSGAPMTLGARADELADPDGHRGGEGS
jgi:xanthine dehydrogenase accessory factor